MSIISWHLGLLMLKPFFNTRQMMWGSLYHLIIFINLRCSLFSMVFQFPLLFYLGVFNYFLAHHLSHLKGCMFYVDQWWKIDSWGRYRKFLHNNSSFGTPNSIKTILNENRCIDFCIANILCQEGDDNQLHPISFLLHSVNN